MAWVQTLAWDRLHAMGVAKIEKKKGGGIARETKKKKMVKQMGKC